MSILNFFLLIITIQNAFSNELKFPFYILPNSKSGKLITSPIKSFKELPQIPVSQNEDDRMCLELCFGTPKICHLLTIHAQSFLIWVLDNDSFNNNKEQSKQKYNPNLSSTSSYDKTLVEVSLDSSKKKNVLGHFVHDRIYTSDSYLFRGTFLSVLRSKYYEDEGMIGLGYRGSEYEEEISFINQLYKNELIYHRVFTQNFKDNNEGVISFGEIPKEIVKNYKYYGRCPALNKEKKGKIYKNRKWECQVYGIYFGDEYDEKKVHVINTRTSFFSFRKRALVPKKIFEYFVKDYFNKIQINDNKCEIIQKKKYYTIECEKPINEGPKINLVFGDWVMSFPISELFDCSTDNNCKFVFNYKRGFENWSLGRPIVKHFHMVYDYQNQEIGFYNQNKVLFINKLSEPAPPREYKKLPDSLEPLENIENNDTDHIKENSQNMKKNATIQDIVDKIKKDVGINEDTKPNSIKKINFVQYVFKIFVVSAFLGLLAYIIIVYYRYKMRIKKLKSDYFIQKAEELSNKV